ncbi:hypothetical protein cypCar_00013186 [Cyprinus carpio]|nr:hypothetical protein cypCar_00013186 [Cyprinus carpio]
MSGKIDSKQESQRSHLTSFTMKLKDKFHSPKIKRTPSNKKSKPPPEQPVKSPEKTVTKSLSRLEEHEKDVVSALRYFKTIIDKMAVDKKVLEMLPGSASKVLEAIMGLVQLDGKILSSSKVSSCLSRLYQSLANLIRWSDQVMLEGVNLEDKETVTTVTTVIKAVLDGVKELVKVAIEKQEHPSPTTPVKTLPPVASPQRPPALPPKKRQSAPSPTRIAVVAPMSRTTSGSSLPIGICRQEYEADALQRRFSGGSHSYGGESPRLSPCGSIGILSKSDEQLSSLEQDSGQCSRNTSCETLDTAESYDPDYDFLHQDLSSIDQIPPAHTGGCLSPLPESHNESSSFPVQLQSIPPALPKKERRPPLPQVERLYSQYDNVPDEDMQAPPFPLFPSMPPSNPGEFMGRFGNAENAQIPQSPQSPPPLPEKKSRHILKYMQFMEDYSEPLPSVFYQTPQSESIYEQRNRKRFQEVYGLSSSDGTLPPPALPPKQRQMSESANDEGGEGEYVNLYSSNQANGDVTLSNGDSSCGAEDSLQDSASEHSKDPADREGWKQKCVDSELTSEEVDELYLIDHDEIILVELTEDILKQLMELVFNLLCNGELTLARVLRKNILDKVQQKKLLQYTNSLKTLAARGVAARGLILQDLTFVHLGNPDLIDGKINFSKRWQQFNILDTMRRFQQVHYDLKHNDDIVSFFNDFSDHLAEEALWELSLKIKPRNITRRKTEREERT